MKRRMTLAIVCLLALSLLTACGGSGTKEVPDVDLAAFCADKAAEYGWDENYLADIEGELLENYYPGLGDIPTKQMVAKAPMMSFVVNEVVFLQCENEEDAAKAAAILQERIDTQAEGGAWYPESMEAWGRGQVIQQGTYVAMIASAEHQEDWPDSFNALFA